MTTIVDKSKTDHFHSLVSFLKFGQEKYMKDLFYNGDLFFNSIQFFRKFEDEELRGDRYEGVSQIWNLPSGTFEIPKLNYKGNYISIHLRESYTNIVGNIYSLYCISSHGWTSPSDFQIDHKNKNFGSYCVIIKDLPKFISLVESKLIEMNLQFRHGLIDYYDKEKVNRKITLFEKPLEFEYQKEFRFYIDRNSEDPIKITIGSLEGIAELHKTEEVVETMKLQMKNNI